MKNDLKDEEVRHVSGGEDSGNEADEILNWMKTNPGFEKPDPSSKPFPDLSDNLKGKKSVVCPKCGKSMMFEILGTDSEGKRLRCLLCNTEFVSKVQQ